MSFYLGCYISDQEYADAFIDGKIRGNREVISVSCWIEDGYVHIALEESYFDS